MIEFIGGSVFVEHQDNKRTFVIKINTKINDQNCEEKKLLCVRGQREVRFEEEVIIQPPPENHHENFFFPMEDEAEMQEMMQEDIQMSDQSLSIH